VPGELPQEFREYFANLEEQVSSAAWAAVYHQCFGCGPEHPRGLRVRSFRTDDGVVSPIVIAPEYAGPPGAAHGGIVAAYLDEVLAAAVLRGTGRVAVTGELTVRYVEPVPVAEPVLGRGWMATDHGRYVDVEGRLEAFPSARILATARGRFFPIGDRIRRESGAS
jgi:acyl-coenzyme A thioesterase PaaI-like protein